MYETVLRKEIYPLRHFFSIYTGLCKTELHVKELLYEFQMMKCMDVWGMHIHVYREVKTVTRTSVSVRGQPYLTGRQAESSAWFRTGKQNKWIQILEPELISVTQVLLVSGGVPRRFRVSKEQMPVPWEMNYVHSTLWVTHFWQLTHMRRMC
jgi:hypothetical protein